MRRFIKKMHNISFYIFHSVYDFQVLKRGNIVSSCIKNSKIILEMLKKQFLLFIELLYGSICDNKWPLKKKLQNYENYYSFCFGSLNLNRNIFCGTFLNKLKAIYI